MVAARLRSKPERGALIGPRAGNASKQALDRQGAGLPAFDNRFDYIGCQIAEPQYSTHMGIAELEALGDLLRVRIFSSTKIPHPDLGTGDSENESLVEPPGQGVPPAWNDDLPARSCTAKTTIGINDVACFAA